MLGPGSLRAFICFRGFFISPPPEPLTSGAALKRGRPAQKLKKKGSSGENSHSPGCTDKEGAGAQMSNQML